MVRGWAVLCLVPLVLGCDGGTGPTPPPTDRVGRWQQDIDSFARVLSEEHANLFFRMPRSRFDSEVGALRAAVSSLSDADIAVGLMRILAMVGDSHTAIDFRSFSGFRQIPIRFDWFSDGIFVVGTTEAHREALGLRVRRVGVAPIESVVESLREVVPYENESWLRVQVVAVLPIPEILEAQSLVPDSSFVRLELEKPDGGSLVVEIPAEPRQQHSYLDAGPGPEALPLYRQHPSEIYWLEYLEGPRALYVHYRQAQEMSTESFAAFTSRVVSILDAEPVGTLVIDLRNNTGGSSAIIEPLLVALERRPSFSSGDGLYTIIGRATFSSGLMNAFDLKRRARAILVGEPTGGKPNHYGQVSSLTLAHSRIRVSYSTRFFRLLPDSDPLSLDPDVRVELTSDDYFRGRDPVLQAVLDLEGAR
jgi:hypothetical protein